MDPSAAGPGASRRKAEQWLSVAEKLLVARDLEGCKQFASQALAADPHTPGADDLHAAAAALLAAQRRRLNNGQPDPYAVLGLDLANPASRHPDTIHSHYRRLSFLLNRSRPDRPSSLAFADAARLVADAWAFLSDPILKSALDADLDAAATAAAAAAAATAPRSYHSSPPNRPHPQPQSQSPMPPRLTPPSATPAPWPTPPSVTPAPRPIPPSATPSPWPTPSVTTAPLPTPPPFASSPRPTPPSGASPPRSILPPAASPLQQAARRPVAPQSRRTLPFATPLLRPTLKLSAAAIRPIPPPGAPRTPTAATTPPVESGAPPPATFWTVCKACYNIHQYDRLYERCKLLCPSCHQPFIAEAMADPPPIVPGTDMYFCSWGFFPVGFPGCPGFEKMVSSPPLGTNQLNAPSLGGTVGLKCNTGGNSEAGGLKGKAWENAENGGLNGNAVYKNDAPISGAVELPIEVPASTPLVKPMRVKVGAKKRGRPKGSKNKKKL